MMVDDFDWGGTGFSSVPPQVARTGVPEGTVRATVDQDRIGLISLSVEFPQTTTVDTLSRSDAEALRDDLIRILGAP